MPRKLMYRRSRRKRYRSLTSTQAKAVKAIVRNSKETFHTTHNYVDSHINNLGQFIRLSNITEGDSDHQRTGDMVSLQKIYGQLVFKMAASLTGTANYNKIMPSLRILILQSKINAPTTTDIPSSVYAPVDLDKFYVIQDKLISMKSPFLFDDGTSKFMLGGPVKYQCKLKSFKHRTLQFDGTNQNPVKNEVFMAIIADENDQGTDVLPITFSGFIQTYYKDL